MKRFKCSATVALSILFAISGKAQMDLPLLEEFDSHPDGYNFGLYSFRSYGSDDPEAAIYTSFSFRKKTKIQPIPVGVIRWDAWYGGKVTDIEEKVLSPYEFQERAPFFSEILSDTSISVLGNSQEVMEQEINFALQSGIGYWAFIMYPWFIDANNDDTGMSTGASLFLEHPDMEKINFCWIVTGQMYWHAGRWDRFLDRALETMKMSNYQTVLDGRPLLYFFNKGIIENEKNIATCNTRLQGYTQAIIAAGGKEPYYVFMGWNIDDWPKARDAGFHAWSHYAGGGSGSFQQAAASVRTSRWIRPAERGIPLVPVVSSGWNRLPRIAYYQKYGNPPWADWNHDVSENCELPKPHELADHLRDAIYFANTHKEVCMAETVILYAWNEHSEGGWVCPTVTHDGGIDSSRVVAVSGVLKNDETVVLSGDHSAKIYMNASGNASWQIQIKTRNKFRVNEGDSLDISFKILSTKDIDFLVRIANTGNITHNPYDNNISVKAGEITIVNFISPKYQSYSEDELIIQLGNTGEDYELWIDSISIKLHDLATGMMYPGCENNWQIYKINHANQLMIESNKSVESLRVSLYDLLGRHIISYQIQHSGKSMVSIPNLKKGLYIVRFSDHKGGLLFSKRIFI